MSTTLLKHSLLLLHGTVYGQIDVLTWHDLSPKSVNIDQWHNPAYDRKVGLFERIPMTASQAGTMTDNAPIDVVHWSAVGVTAVSPMAHWRNCMKLLRHI